MITLLIIVFSISAGFVAGAWFGAATTRRNVAEQWRRAQRYRRLYLFYSNNLLRVEEGVRSAEAGYPIIRDHVRQCVAPLYLHPAARRLLREEEAKDA